MTHFPRQGDNFRTLDIPPHLQGEDPQTIARAMKAQHAPAPAESATGNPIPPRHPATSIGE